MQHGVPVLLRHFCYNGRFGFGFIRFTKTTLIGFGKKHPLPTINKSSFDVDKMPTVSGQRFVI